MDIQKFKRNPFYVDAVKVTVDNMDEVAAWCQGKVQILGMPDGSEPETFIKIKVFRPANERQTKAFPGDWVLHAGRGFKVYQDEAFLRDFEPYIVYTEADAIAQCGEDPDQLTLEEATV